MSVIRRPGVLGQNTQRRIVGWTAALSAATIEVAAVGAWFVLVVVGTRTVSTALAGLGILFCGALLRTGIFGVATRNLVDLFTAWRLLAALALTGIWILWLLVAESAGILAASVVLAALLTGQFALERHAFGIHVGEGRPVPEPIAFVPGTLIALGAAALLVASWNVEWSYTATLLSVDGVTYVLRIQPYQFGLVALWLSAFVAQQRRIYRTLVG